MRKSLLMMGLMMVFCVAVSGVTQAADVETVSVAVFQFQAKERALEDQAALASDLVDVQLAQREGVAMVSREEIQKVLTEQQMNLSGLTEANAPAIGKLVGAQVIVVGRLFNVEKNVFVTARLISTETSRTFAAKVSGDAAKIDELATQLGDQLGELLDKNRDVLVVPTQLKKEQLAELSKALGKKDLPRVFVHVRENTPNIVTIDPAAQTEIQHILIKCGFDVVKDQDGTLAKWADKFMADGGKTAPPDVDGVDMVIIGEGMSEYGAKNGDLISCRARLELEMLDPGQGKVLASDRETASGVDLAEQIASKTALQNAAATLAMRMLPDGVKGWQALKESQTK